MTDPELAAAWSELHDANKPLGWYVGRPSYHDERREWVMYAFDHGEKVKPGKPRKREWQTVGQTEALRRLVDGLLLARDSGGQGAEVTTLELLTYTEGRLRHLGDGLDKPWTFEPEQAGSIALLMGHRGRSLFAATHHLLTGPSDAAARILLTSMGDLAILTAWLRLNPFLHAELWEAELERQRVRLAEALEVRQLLRPELDPFPEPDLDQHRQTIAKARARGVSAAVGGVSKKDDGPVMPTIYERVLQIETLAAFELYAVLVSWLSEWTHSGKGSFRMDPVDAQTATIVEAAPNPNDEAIRSLAAVFYAYILGEVSRWIGMGIEGECDVLRSGLTAPTKRSPPSSGEAGASRR